MPVTFKVAAHDSNAFVSNRRSKVEKPIDVLKMTWERGNSNYDRATRTKTRQTCKDLIQTSLKADAKELQSFSAANNGFLQSIISAYNGHHNLIIRPDDVWIAILSQFNLYVNANAESLRSKFVSHEGKEDITVICPGPTRYDIDYKWLAEEMTNQLRKKIVDPDMRRFIYPNFSTTTDVDTAIGCIMMMSTLKKYFNFKAQILCGIPSITLLGRKSDYERIYRRLDKLETFGEEPRVFAALLRPIIREILDVFDKNGAQLNLDFWSRICHYKAGGSGPDYLSGWVTAFCVWGKEGVWQGPNMETFATPVSVLERLQSERFYEDNPTSESFGLSNLSLDGPPPVLFGDVRYPVIELSNIPNGYCEVDVLVDENGTEYGCKMVAGHLGFIVSGEKMDTVQPSPQWFMFEKEEIVS